MFIIMASNYVIKTNNKSQRALHHTHICIYLYTYISAAVIVTVCTCVRVSVGMFVCVKNGRAECSYLSVMTKDTVSQQRHNFASSPRTDQNWTTVVKQTFDHFNGSIALCMCVCVLSIFVCVCMCMCLYLCKPGCFREGEGGSY